MYTTFISTSDLAERLNNSDWLIIDCRFSLNETEKGRQDYQAAHISGAIYAHLEQDLSAPIIPQKTGRHPLPDIKTLVQTFSKWGIDERVQVIAYDDTIGSIAARLWWMLRWLGHDKIAVLDGGWKQWQQEARPVTDELPWYAPRTFTATPRPYLLAKVEEVQKRATDPDWKLLDARSLERYRGENEPIDPVAGHIPGAISAPFTENADLEGKILSQEELRNRFRPILDDVETNRTISYCGSGITACHNLLALQHAGLGEGKLYPGSWSEWIIDKKRPLATRK